MEVVEPLVLAPLEVRVEGKERLLAPSNKQHLLLGREVQLPGLWRETEEELGLLLGKLVLEPEAVGLSKAGTPRQGPAQLVMCKFGTAVRLGRPAGSPVLLVSVLVF